MYIDKAMHDHGLFQVICRVNRLHDESKDFVYIIDYIHYFCGENGIDEKADETFARSREKLYKLVNRLTRAYAEITPRMTEVDYSSAEQAKFESRVNFYLTLRETIGRASGDFIDLKMYEPGMRYLIDNYIQAEDAERIGILDDFTLLDFILTQK